MSSGVTMGNVLGMYVLSTTINPASVAINTTAEQTFALPGVKLNDIIVVIKPTLSAGLGIVNSRVSANDTIAIQFANVTAGAIDAPAELYEVLVVRPSGNTPATSIGD